MTLHELYLKAAEKVKEFHPKTKLIEYIQSNQNGDVPYSSQKELSIFQQVIEDYLKDIIGVDYNKSVEIYGRVSSKKETYIVIEILYILSVEKILLKWNEKIFSDINVLHLVNGAGKSDAETEKFDQLKEGDYIICTLSANNNFREILAKSKPFSFNWNSLNKAEPMKEDSQYVCNIVRVLNLPKNGEEIVLPVGENLARILDQNIKDKTDKIDNLEKKVGNLEIKEKRARELDKDIKQKKQELDELKKEINYAEVDRSVKNTKILELEDKINKNYEKLNEIQRDVEEKKSYIESKQNEVFELERKVGDLEIKEKCVKELNKDLQQKKQELDEIKGEILAKNQKCSEINNEVNKCNTILTAIKEEIEEKSNSEEYKAVKFAQKFIVTEKEKELLLPQVDFADFDTNNEDFINELSEYMQGYMYNDGFLYSKEILKNTFYALQTNQLIIYAGKPGSGKSQLVKHLADLFGAGYADVAVQSSWMDKSDLLGFYDPIHNNYIGTAFLDKLREMCKEARNNPERLFIMCLDEMNLAHVEYYFADFLSRLQASNDERSIDLYSKTTENELKEEVILRTSRCIENINDADFYKKDFLKNFVSSNVDEFVRVKKMWNMLVEYPHKIDIPKNVKFFGTINTDATTKDLSPKVLDRAFVFKLEREDIDVPKKRNYDKKVDFYSITNKTKNVDKCEKNAQNAVAIFNDLTNNDLNISISMRVQKQLAQISYATESDLADILFACIILPKISGISMEKANEKLQYRCEPYKYAKTVYGFIKTNCIGSSYYSFWR